MNAIEFAATHDLKLTPVGSRVTCDPPPLDTDRDYLVYTETAKVTVLALGQDGWEQGGSLDGEYGSGWAGFRKGEDNIILAWDTGFYRSFLCATAAAKALNL